MGMRREPESSYKKFFPALANSLFWRIASESEEVFARIFDIFFRCSGLPKTSVF